MLIRWIRFLTIIFIGFGMGPAIGHLLEMPAKMNYDSALWLKLLKTLYPPAFGLVGGVAEGIATIFSVVLVFMVRRRGRTLMPAVFGAACMLAAHAAFWVLIAPVNAVLVPLSPETLPANFIELRNRWEYTHAARAVLQVVALGAMVWSVLVETPVKLSAIPPSTPSPG